MNVTVQLLIEDCQKLEFVARPIRFVSLFLTTKRFHIETIETRDDWIKNNKAVRYVKQFQR